MDNKVQHLIKNKMIKGCSGFLFALIVSHSLAQDTINKKIDSTKVHVNGFINIVPDNYNSVLFGSVNLAHGSQEGLQFSLFNWNQHNFNGDHLQLATLNIVGGSINDGTQVGFLNFCIDSLKGTQVGLFNFSKKRDGTQIGFVNYCDTMSTGFSFGVISIVKKGFHAFEFGLTEMYPINISYKVGASKSLYNSVNFSCNYEGNINNAMNGPILGFGFGSIIPVSKSFFVNPDFSFQAISLLKSRQKLLALSVKLSCAIAKKIHISVGPSYAFTFVNIGTDPKELHMPIYSLYENPVTDPTTRRQRNYIGLRFSLRYIIREG